MATDHERFLLMQAASHRPQSIDVDRSSDLLSVQWADGHASSFRLEWLRMVCPCATCAEEKRNAGVDPLRLVVGPPPSASVTDAELVGNYALRLRWADGHDGGIYSFAQLRASCPCPLCCRSEPPHLLVV